MIHIVLSKEAQKDLISIHNYIRYELCNPDAAQKVIAALKKSIVSLEIFPERGKPLDALISVHTEYRYITCQNYCIFYLCTESEVLVVRILHQLQDSFRALFLPE